MKSKLKISIIIIIAIAVITIIGAIIVNKTSNKSGSDTLDDAIELKKAELLKQDEILYWDDVYEVISKDNSKVVDYSGKTVIYTGTIRNINESNNSIILTNSFRDGIDELLPVYNENNLNVFLNNVNNLEEKDTICVIGKLNITGYLYDLEDACIMTSKDYDSKRFYIDVVEKNGSYYYDYEFDTITGLPTKYSTVWLNVQNKIIEDKYRLRYDDNQNLTMESVEKYIDGEESSDHTTFYEYDSDNTLVKEKYKYSTYTYNYEKNENGQVIKKIDICTDIFGEKSTQSETTYEYNEDNQVVKETEIDFEYKYTKVTTYKYNKKGQVISTTTRSSNITTNCTYEYNEKGQIIAKTIEVANEIDKYTYEYDERGNEIKKFENGEMKEYCQYGIVGIK